MLYPEYIQHRKPEINLPYPKYTKTFIYEFYEIFEAANDPRTEAKCKQCGESVFMMRGTIASSSYTSGLVAHLKKHPGQWNKYLDRLKDTITPDNKTPRQHYQSRIKYKVSDKEVSSRNLEICTRNYHLNRKNCAGVVYTQRDIEIFKNQVSYEHQNADILQYLHSYTNQNVHIFELIGTKHPGARLDGSYKKTKCLVDNDGDIILDLERLLCEHVCFFDPAKYGQCLNENEHRGNISIFSNLHYQERFEGFKQEIEQYPEFQCNKTFHYNLLENTDIIEQDKRAMCEMNRLLKILISLVIIHKPTINEKLRQLLGNGIDNDRLRKPNLGIQLWGPKGKNLDHSGDASIPDTEYSTFQHVNISECPAYTDNTKKASHIPHFKQGRAYYPCNTGSCLKGCVCIPCNDSQYSEANSFKCRDHPIDHPEMFDETEDLAVSRRKFIESDRNQPIFKRPVLDKHLCPPKIKLAQMKKKCKICRKVFEDHINHHHILHLNCQICSHMVQSSQISFKLTCYLCFKIFKNKYKLGDHMQIHDDESPYSCNICVRRFTCKQSYDRHVMNKHNEKQLTFKCDICDELFPNRFNLARHTNDMHTSNKEVFNCNLCESTFKRKDTLMRHERTIHGQIRNEAQLPGANRNTEPFKCYQCENGFKDKNTLIRHIESLHEAALLQCNVCYKEFTRKDTLQIHMQSHNYTLPRIICELCRREFSSKLELRKHRLDIHERAQE